jgi:hypothetical protein
MSFYMCFDWFKKLRLFVYVLNRKIDVILKVPRVVVIRWFSLKEAPFPLKWVQFIWNFLSQDKKKGDPFYTGDCMGRFECYGITTYHEVSSNAVIEKCVIENFIWIEPILRGHLSYQATFFLCPKRWPLNTCLTVFGF